MVQFDEQRLRLEGYERELEDLGDALDLEAARAEIEELEKRSAAEDFWNDMENSQKILKKITKEKNKIAAYDRLKAADEDKASRISGIVSA